MTPKVKMRHQAELEVAQAEAPHLRQVSWLKDPGLRKLYAWAFILWIASWTTGYDGSMLNNMRIIDNWENYFHNPQGSLLGFLTALYQIGSLVSLPIVPFIADHFGRKTAIAIGCFLMIVGGAIQAGATSLSIFMGGRFLLGFGNSLAQLCSPLLLTEICHPQHRGRVTAVYNCLWNVGFIINTWLTFGTQHINGTASWRIPAALQCSPSVVQIICIYWCPESPRWLVAKDRNEEALDILAKYHANGNRDDPTVQFEFREIKETLRLEFQYKRTSSYLDFIRTKGNRYRLMVIISLGFFSQWSGNGLVSYFSKELYDSVGYRSSTAQLGLNGGLSIMSLIISVTCASLVDRVGRRPLFLAATAGMLFAFVIWTICAALFQSHGVEHAAIGVVVMIWIFSACYALAWSGLLVAYTVEILPFKIRAKGLMIMNLCVQAALTINDQVNPIAIKKLKHAYELYAIYTGWIFLELVFVYSMYVETRGPTLEELAKIIDGEDAEVAHVDLEEVEKDAIRREERIPDSRFNRV